MNGATNGFGNLGLFFTNGRLVRLLFASVLEKQWKSSRDRHVDDDRSIIKSKRSPNNVLILALYLSLISLRPRAITLCLFLTGRLIKPSRPLVLQLVLQEADRCADNCANRGMGTAIHRGGGERDERAHATCTYSKPTPIVIVSGCVHG